MSERRARILLGLILLAFSALAWSAPGRDVWTIDPDAAAYVGLARSIAHGDGYTLDGVPHAKFPPGFPALLSVAVFAAGDDAWGRMQDLVTLAGLLGLALVYPIGRRVLGLSPGGALLLAFFAATSRFWLNYSVSFLRSEPLFFLLMNLGVLFGERWRTRGGIGAAAASGLALGLATVTRTAGAALVPAVWLARHLDLRPLRFRGIDRGGLVQSAVFLVLAAAPTGAFKATLPADDADPRSSGYMDELLSPYALDLTKDVDEGMETISPFSREMFDRVRQNLSVLSLSLGKFAANDPKGANLAVDPDSPPWALDMRAPGWLLLLLLAAGLARAAARNQALVVIGVSAYVALYLIWPFNQQERFYMPAQPLLLYLLALGAAAAVPWAALLVSRPAGRIAAIAGLAAVTAIVAGGRSDEGHLLGRYSAEYAALLGGLATATVALATLAAVARGRPLDAGRVRAFLTRAAMVALVGWNLLVPIRVWNALSRDHDRFLAGRASNPVPARFDRIRAHPELIQVFRELMAHAGPDDVVMSDIPKMIHLATGLHAVPARVDSKSRRILLEPRDGRAAPRLLYISPEVPQITSVVDEHIRREPERFRILYEIPLEEGEQSIPLCVYEVLDP